jgi:tryptophan-rich sensory protein
MVNPARLATFRPAIVNLDAAVSPTSIESRAALMSNISTHVSRDSSSLRVFGETLTAVVAVNALGAGAGVLAGSGGENEWYQTLEKPSFNPPGWVFAPVWTTLYTLMGISLSILWRARKDSPSATPAVQLFSIQLVLNLLWSFLFFRWENPGAALIEIVVLNAAIVLTILAAWRVSKTAALLLVPYLCWTLFATLLNAAIWHLNR